MELLGYGLGLVIGFIVGRYSVTERSNLWWVKGWQRER